MFEKHQEVKWNGLRTGGLIFLALVLVFSAIFFSGILESVFVQKIEITMTIQDARGLRSGAPIWFSGIEVGSVKSIAFNGENGLSVRLSLQKKPAQMISSDATATIMTMGLLGDKYLEIKNGFNHERLTNGSYLSGKNQLETLDIVEAASHSLGGVSDFTTKLSFLIDHLNRSEGTLSGLINDPAVYNNLKSSTASLLVLLNQLSDSNGSVHELSVNPSLYQHLDESAKNLSMVLNDLEAGKGTAGKILKDEVLAEHLKHAVTSLDESATELKALIKDMKDNPKKYFKFSLF
jgi:phospholipid/cholesterol/gamma-HCH transport system substrate-binding protein